MQLLTRNNLYQEQEFLKEAPSRPIFFDQTVIDDVGLSTNAFYLLKERFLRKSPQGDTIENPSGLFRRVAHALARAELLAVREQWREKFYEVMVKMEFHPGTRTLANAGTPHQQLANCFVFPLPDTQSDIFKTVQDSAIIKGHGGGCGFNYSTVRPKGDTVRDVPDLAVGPVKLMKLFDMTTTMFRQQGRYESGNMAVLNVDHPDILDFIAAKKQDGSLSMTNISLGVTNKFMEAVIEERPWDLINPRTGEVMRTLPAREIFETACRYAAETGDPGILFLDHINKDNPLRESMGDINATNPCGEIGLYPYEACNLGYLNLTKFLLPESRRTDKLIFDEARLQDVVSVGIRMIDNAISVSWFPITEIQEAVQANRRIGLGVTGWADCLALSGIPYDSEAALALAERLSATMYQAAYRTSVALAKERGPFPNVEHSTWRGLAEQPRNVALLAFPPSGNNAVIFDTSFAIEPYFALAYSENILGGVYIHHLNKHLLKALRSANLPTDGLAELIAEHHGSIQHIPWIPADIKTQFKTAHDIAPKWH
ncbi:MAG: adenosylcobalamin-dependent ribonucleoside-diphosphate reductase, partial [Anaerolineae bacterium]|nr:adenosylcobalamin-dependent ribonucleoside-diphosphate reductase [Anaerolineae bacterium]